MIISPYRTAPELGAQTSFYECGISTARSRFCLRSRKGVPTKIFSLFHRADHECLLFINEGQSSKGIKHRPEPFSGGSKDVVPLKLVRDAIHLARPPHIWIEYHKRSRVRTGVFARRTGSGVEPSLRMEQRGRGWSGSTVPKPLVGIRLLTSRRQQFGLGIDLALCNVDVP